MDSITYNIKSKATAFKNDRIKHWIASGAQVSDTAHNMLVREHILDAKKKNVLSKKSPTVKRKELKKK